MRFEEPISGPTWFASIGIAGDSAATVAVMQPIGREKR